MSQSHAGKKISITQRAKAISLPVDVLYGGTASDLSAAGPGLVTQASVGDPLLVTTPTSPLALASGILRIGVSATDKYLYSTGANTWTEGTITSFGRDLVDSADAAAGRDTLGASSGVWGLALGGSNADLSSGAASNYLRGNAGGTAWEYRTPANVLADIGAAAAAHTHAHSALTGLTSGDDHTQYALLAGRASGQTLIGGTAASENLTLTSTSHGTKGWIDCNGILKFTATATANPSENYIRAFTGDIIYYNADGSGSHQWLINGTGPFLTIQASAGAARVGIGLAATIAARALEVRSTSAQQRWSYDASNYWEIAASAAGVCSFVAAGTGPVFTFNRAIGVQGITPATTNWTTAGYSRGVEMPNVSVIRWPLNTGYSWGLGTSGGILRVIKSTADDASATAVTACQFEGDAWTTAGWIKGINFNASTAVRWRVSSGVSWGIGTTGATLAIMSSTADDNSAAAAYIGAWSTAGLYLGGLGTAARALEVRSTSAQVRGSYDGSNYWEIAATATGNLSIHHAGVAIGIGNATTLAATGNSIAIGYQANASGGSGPVALGSLAAATGVGGCIAIGGGATSSGSSPASIAIGFNSTASATQSIAIGPSASVAVQGIAIGQSATVTGHFGIALGGGASAAGNTFVAGGGNFPINNVYYGKGVTHATPTAWTLNGTGGSGTDIAGANLVLAPGRPTGSGNPGNLLIQFAPAGVSGTTLGTLATYADWRIGGLLIGTSGAAARMLEVRSTSAQIRGSYDATNYWEISVDLNGNLSITGAGTAANGINIGRGSGTPGASSTILGTSATAAGASSVAIGRLASAAGGAAVAIGLSSSTGANNGAICIGESASNTGGNSVAIGRSATAAANQFVSGNPTYFISNVFFGSGALASVPVAYTLNGSGGSGTDIAGANLTIAGGKGTGNAVGGSVKIQTSTAGASGTTLQTLATVAEFGVAAIGLYGVAPVVQSTGWSVTNPTTRKAIDVTALTHGELCELVGTLVQRLLDLGVIAA